MNGCLSKFLLVFVIMIGLMAGYPYIKKYLSDSVQEKIDNSHRAFTILQKITHSVVGNELNKSNNQNKNNNNQNNQQNDNTENQKTGQ